ncbi:hypothetical protein OSH11_11825 [Kaistia dalseonensis]|uniref:Terminase small subunit n=1 Tax=Kaistia dalseonensis TaxID=410840 RepID=A0ABU0H6S1_9HYPH|nr:hypothetical protein [Kaistia dalseonensis]MCX5495397.1 hypothetical protein [Kaistia dalseonensis]MDQ0437985.1 hypothetical protein [Kaistia dalseonensis]
MARGRKKKQESTGPKRLPSVEEVKAAVAEVSRQKAHASEYGGLAGQATKTFTERYGIHRKAFGFIAGLDKMDDQKRQSCLRDAMILADRLGYFDQADAFDDLGSAVRDVIDDAAIGNDAERKARTEAELAEDIPAVDKTVTERLAEQEQWDSASEVAKAKEAAARKKAGRAGAADQALSDEIDATLRPN